MDALKPRLWLEALWQVFQSARLVVWLRNGGRGFWRFFAERLAGKAIGIPGFYHAVQHLWEAATVRLDGRTKSAREWFVSASPTAA